VKWESEITFLSNNCIKYYYNRTLTVQVIVEDVVTWIFWRYSVHAWGKFQIFKLSYLLIVT